MRIHTYTQCFLERNGTRHSILNRRDLQQSCTKKNGTYVMNKINVNPKYRKRISLIHRKD